MIVFRLFIIGGSLNFLLFAILVGYIFIDGVIFNVIMISINIYHLFFLIRDKIEIKLSPIEENIFQKVFKNSMNRRTCKQVLDKGKFFHLSDNEYIAEQGKDYNGLYLVAYIKDNYNINIYIDNKLLKKNSNSYRWIGVIEYDMYLKKNTINNNKTIQTKWPVSIKLDINDEVTTNKNENNSINNIDENKETNLNNKELDYKYPCYLYYFNIEDLEKLYNSKNGINIKNALNSVWLDSLTHYIFEVDSTLVKIKHQSQNYVFNNLTNNCNNNNNKSNISNYNETNFDIKHNLKNNSETLSTLIKEFSSKYINNNYDLNNNTNKSKDNNLDYTSNKNDNLDIKNNKLTSENNIIINMYENNENLYFNKNLENSNTQKLFYNNCEDINSILDINEKISISKRHII